MLWNLGRQFHRLVSWRIAIPADDIFDAIAFSYITLYAIRAIFMWRISDIFPSNRVPPACVSSFSASFFSDCIPWSSVGVWFTSEASVDRSTDTVLRIPSSSIVTVVGLTSRTRNDPIMVDSSLLYDWWPGALFNLAFWQYIALFPSKLRNFSSKLRAGSGMRNQLHYIVQEGNEPKSPNSTFLIRLCYNHRTKIKQ